MRSATSSNARNRRELDRLAALWSEAQAYLQARDQVLREEIHTYPSPIARCDVQLTQLLEHRATVFRLLRRLDAVPPEMRTAADYAAALDEFISATTAENDPTDDALKSRLRQALVQA